MTTLLPASGPRFRTLTLPPWSCTRLRTSARPTPRPPSVRASLARSSANTSKACSNASGGMPRPLSDGHADLLAFMAYGDGDTATGLGVVHAVGQYVAHHLDEPVPIAMNGQALVEGRQHEVLLACHERIAARLDSAIEHVLHFHPLTLQLDGPLLDAAQVQ